MNQNVERGRGLAAAGMEKATTVISAPLVQWNPLPARSTWVWPGGARLAVAFLFHIEFLPLTPPGELRNLPASAVHRGPYPRYIDVHEVTPHEYGNRVGLFRLMRLFDDYGFNASAAVDTVIAKRYPAIVNAIKSRDWAVLGHGSSGAELLSEVMPEEEEREVISANLAALAAAFERDVEGWASVEYSESSRSVDLFRESGLRYVCGWPNDEQPYSMTDDFACVPVSIHLDDVFAGRLRKITATDHADSIIRAIDELVTESDPAPKCLVLGIHPWYSGQPFRVKQFKRVLERIKGDPRIWVSDTDSLVNEFSGAKELSK